MNMAPSNTSVALWEDIEERRPPWTFHRLVRTEVVSLHHGFQAENDKRNSSVETETASRMSDAFRFSVGEIGRLCSTWPASAKCNRPEYIPFSAVSISPSLWPSSTIWQRGFSGRFKVLWEHWAVSRAALKRIPPRRISLEKGDYNIIPIFLLFSFFLFFYNCHFLQTPDNQKRREQV